MIVCLITYTIDHGSPMAVNIKSTHVLSSYHFRISPGDNFLMFISGYNILFIVCVEGGGAEGWTLKSRHLVYV